MGATPKPGDAPRPGLTLRARDSAVKYGIKKERQAEQLAVPKPVRSGLVRAVSGALTAPPRTRGAVYLLLDTSASMADRGKMAGLLNGSLRLFAEARRQDLAVGVVEFASRTHLLLRASCDEPRFRTCLKALAPGGRTAMAPAIRLATRLLRGRRGEKTILLVTDGQPDDPAATLDAARLARAQGVTLIAIGTDGADEAFLAALTPKPELAVKVEPGRLESAIVDTAKRLP